MDIGEVDVDIGHAAAVVVDYEFVVVVLGRGRLDIGCYSEEGVDHVLWVGSLACARVLQDLESWQVDGPVEDLLVSIHGPEVDVG